MIREITATNRVAARELAPNAAIIRPIGYNLWLAFDHALEALGHPTAQIMENDNG